MLDCTAQHHDLLDVTGLSSDSGGWIARRPFLYKDPVYPGSFSESRAQLRKKLNDLHASSSIRMARIPGDYTRPEVRRREKGPLPANRVKAILWGTAHW